MQLRHTPVKPTKNLSKLMEKVMYKMFIEKAYKGDRGGDKSVAGNS